MQAPAISVVTPTLGRPDEVIELVENLARQHVLPAELILVDGAVDGDRRTQLAVESVAAPFPVRYERAARGTALQRNAGIDLAAGELIALIDDDVRLDPMFFAEVIEVFQADPAWEIGAVVGYRVGSHARVANSARWRWYRRLRLFQTYEPGHYDWATGYPINANLQPPFRGTRPVDFMTTACAVWRRQVMDDGLRFDTWFRDYGVLEDAHFSLRAGRRWQLVQCGDARCEELTAAGGRVSQRRIGYKSVVNYWYVFADLGRPLSRGQCIRFWRFQVIELVRTGAGALRSPRGAAAENLRGRLEGIAAVVRSRGAELPSQPGAEVQSR